MKKPSPRLQFEWHKTNGNWKKSECVYSLVIPLREYDIRAEDSDGARVRDELVIEIGKTSVSGFHDKKPVYGDGIVNTPFRDGAHAQFDNKALGGELPIVAVCGDEWSIVDNQSREN